MEEVEERGVDRHQRQVADAYDVEGRDHQQPDAGTAQPRRPRGRKRQNRPQAERHGVAPATARIDVDRVGRRAGQLIGHALLELGEGHEELAFHPTEPHHPEQADKPRPGRQREAEHP